MSKAFENFRRGFFKASILVRLDAPPLNLLDQLSAEERALAADQLIESLSIGDPWPANALGHLRSTKALPSLYALLQQGSPFMKITFANAIYQINADHAMSDIVLEQMPAITDKYVLIDALHLLPDFKDPRITALLEEYARDSRYLVAYNATAALGKPTGEIVARFRKRKL